MISRTDGIWAVFIRENIAISYMEKGNVKIFHVIGKTSVNDGFTTECFKSQIQVRNNSGMFHLFIWLSKEFIYYIK